MNISFRWLLTGNIGFKLGRGTESVPAFRYARTVAKSGSVPVVPIRRTKVKVGTSSDATHLRVLTFAPVTPKP